MTEFLWFGLVSCPPGGTLFDRQILITTYNVRGTRPTITDFKKKGTPAPLENKVPWKTPGLDCNYGTMLFPFDSDENRAAENEELPLLIAVDGLLAGHFATKD